MRSRSHTLHANSFCFLDGTPAKPPGEAYDNLLLEPLTALTLNSFLSQLQRSLPFLSPIQAFRLVSSMLRQHLLALAPHAL